KKILKGSETVLVIEDEELLRDSSVKILKKFGYNVLEASSGEKGVALCQEYEKPIHLLVSDIMLPGALNGKEASVEIQKIFPDIKVIFMSGYTENIIAHEGILDKDIVFLQKPFEINNFLETIRRVLESN
ncbi:response regulator, partial [bacterium]|nr:response regulator [bacterium]